MLSLGRTRALQASTTARGVFSILAIDHRDAMRVMVNPNAPETVSSETLTEIKLAVVSKLAAEASAVLLDPLYSAKQAIATHTLPGHVGLLCALEDQGYLGDPFARETVLLNGWSVEQAKLLGATGVKLLLLYNPDTASADKQDALVRGVLEDCARFEIPLFLEPISYATDTTKPKGGPEFARQRRRIVIESVRRLGALKPDILKVEFPLDVKHDKNETVWADACAELNAASPVPWALLSGDEPFDTFKRQVRIACENGCSGFLVGRSVWRDATTLTGAARDEFLETTARPRLRELAAIADRYAMPWHKH